MHGCILRIIGLIVGVIGLIVVSIFIVESITQYYESPKEKGIKGFFKAIKEIFKSFAKCWNYYTDDEQGLSIFGFCLLSLSLGLMLYSFTTTHAKAEAACYYKDYTKALTEEAKESTEPVIGSYDAKIVKPKKSNEYKENLDYWYERASR